MKRKSAVLTIAFFVLGSVLVSCAHFQPVKAEDCTFFQVYEAPGHSKDELFDQAKMWIAKTFKSAKAVIEYENKENGTIIGNGLMDYPCKGVACPNWDVGFTMKIETKDDKFKMTFDNLTISWPAWVDAMGYHASNPGSPISNQAELNAIKPALLNLGERMKNSLGQEMTEKSDW